MAVSVSPPGKYPGAYVQTQIDSQPPTGGTATSVGAFIGRTPQGPVNVPISCLSFADYERNFGGLSLHSSVSYQANGFFNNGGGQAEVVRLYRLPSVTITATNASVTAVGKFTLTLELQAKLNDAQNGVLNPEGINALCFFTGAGSVVWGARTLRGVDQFADQYKYIPVQRLLDYIETSLLVDTRWAVFQPNGEALWSKLQNQISVFMSGLFTQGAFSGTSASQAYFVKCDSTTTTLADAAAGIVNVRVGFAPIYPAEFVVITISQLTASSS